jgi:hypothetical protein
MAITRTQIAKQLLANGGRIGFANGAQFEAARRGESISPGTKSDEKASADRVAAATNIESMQDAFGTKDSVTKEQQEARDRLRDQRDTTREAIRENAREARNEKIAQTFGSLLPTRRNLFNRSLLIPGATKNITRQRKAYEDYLRSMGVIPSLELEDTDDLYSFFEKQAFQKDPTVPGREIKSYGDFILDEFGNPTVKYSGDIGAYRRDMGIDDRGPSSEATKIIPEPTDPNQDPDDEEEDSNRFFRLFAEGGSVDDVEREAMFLGGITKGIKKAVKGIKKIAKSPIGKAALIAGGAGFFGMGPFAGLAKTKAGIGLSNLFGAGSFSPFKAELTNVLGTDAGFGPSGLGRLLGDKFVNQVTGNLTGMGKFAALGIPSALAGIMTDKQKDEFKEPDYPDFNLQAYLREPYKYTPTRQMADGGIMREDYQEGSKEPVAKKTMPLLDMDGKEMDFREEGGFVPIGRMEKADDVPARLSKNEFVFTADAVRNAGEGDVDKGAEVMYNMMKNLESGGEVSEESQGLEGAREMFQTSKRLEEVL